MADNGEWRLTAGGRIRNETAGANAKQARPRSKDAPAGSGVAPAVARAATEHPDLSSNCRGLGSAHRAPS